MFSAETQNTRNHVFTFTKTLQTFYSILIPKQHIYIGAEVDSGDQSSREKNIIQLVSICHSHQDLPAHVQQWAPTAVSHLEWRKTSHSRSYVAQIHCTALCHGVPTPE